MVELDDEFLWEYILITNEKLHEGSHELSLFRVTLLEVENDGLQEMLDAYFAILLDQVDESFLISFPCLHDVILLACVKASAEEDPVAEFGWKALRGSDELEFIEDWFNLAWVL